MNEKYTSELQSILKEFTAVKNHIVEGFEILKDKNIEVGLDLREDLTAISNKLEKSFEVIKKNSERNLQAERSFSESIKQITNKLNNLSKTSNFVYEKKAIAANPELLNTPEMAEIAKDKDAMLEILAYAEPENMSLIFMKMWSFYRDDKDVVMELSKSGAGLYYISKRLKDDEDIILESVKSSKNSLNKVVKQIEKTENTISNYLETNGSSKRQMIKNRLADILQSLDESTVNEFVLDNLEDTKTNFEHASRRLKEDKEFVLKIVSEDGLALSSVAKALRCDKEVIFAAVKNNADAAINISDKLFEDVEFVSELVKVNKDVAKYIPEKVIKKINWYD